MILATSFLDAGTWVPLGSLVIVAAVCWRLASAKAEYAADLRRLQDQVAGGNRKLDALAVEMDRLWASHGDMRDRMGKVEGRLNGGPG